MRFRYTFSQQSPPWSIHFKIFILSSLILMYLICLEAGAGSLRWSFIFAYQHLTNLCNCSNTSGESFATSSSLHKVRPWCCTPWLHRWPRHCPTEGSQVGTKFTSLHLFGATLASLTEIRSN